MIIENRIFCLNPKMLRNNNCLVETTKSNYITAGAINYITVRPRTQLTGTLTFTPLDNAAFFANNKGTSTFGAMFTSNRENKYMLPVVNNSSCDINVKKGEVLGVFEIINKHDDLMSISNAYFDLNQTNGKNVFDLSRTVDNLVSCSQEKKITKRNNKRSKVIDE